jgi:hypothetical protein
MGHHLVPGIVDRLVDLSTDLARDAGATNRLPRGRTSMGDKR